MKNTVYFLAYWVVLPTSLFAQITTSAISGIVREFATKATIPGANVLATHVPSGTHYGASTDIDGRYRLTGLKPGGPYTVRVSFIGFQSDSVTNIFLELGNPTTIDFKLREENFQLQEVTIVSEKDPLFDAGRMGMETTVSSREIATMPTLTRSLSDFTRMTPQANLTNGGISFAGMNNRFNNISIDGAVSNDVFGLSQAGTPGGRQGANLISLDAVQALQIVLTPFDVRQSGFVGGGINAITRSGSNQTEGSAYFYTRGFSKNNPFTGTKIQESTIDKTSFYRYNYGARIGGAIVKDKLFYFVNFERIDEGSPYTTRVENGRILLNNSQIVPDYADAYNQIKAIKDYVDSVYGYNVGEIEARPIFRQENNELTTRIDWNISQKHKFTVRYTYNQGKTNDQFTSSRTNFIFNNAGFYLNFTKNNIVTELQSRFSNKLSNEFRIGYNRLRDDSQPMARDFPNTRIRLGQDFANASVYFGTDRDRGANYMHQDLIEITDNLTYFHRKHTFVVGTRNEIFYFDNLYMRYVTGRFEYGSFDEFKAATPSLFEKTYASDPTQYKVSAKLTAAQFGFYAQDEIQWEKLSLSLGIRADIPVLAGNVNRNERFEVQFGYRNNVVPRTQVLWSPRIGFNWTPEPETRKIQIRGGIGIFSGRSPFVWIMNQFANDGIRYNRAIYTRANDINQWVFPSNATQQERQRIIGDPRYRPAGSTVTEINMTTDRLRYPQVLRTMLAVDFKLPFSMSGSVEAMYGKTLSDIYVRNIGVAPKAPRGTDTILVSSDGRMLYGYQPSAPAPFQGSANFYDGVFFNNVYVLENTSLGHQLTLTHKLEKKGKNYLASLAYSQIEAKDVASLDASTAGSNFANSLVAGNNFNNPSLSYSDFAIKNRLVGAFNYTFNKYSKRTSTSIGIFYNGQNNGRASYIVTGDANFDGVNGNDLMYIPKNVKDEFAFASATFGGVSYTPEQQAEAFEKFIQENRFMRINRGKYIPRNAIINPWLHRFDVKIIQRIHFKNENLSKQSLEVSADIFHVANLLNPNWGVARFYQTSSLLTFQRVRPDGKPEYTFNPNYQQQLISLGATQVWRLQFGIRYNF
ncbi:MAG: carboxypeptidase regulatory-like domain-containing protein [Cytophagales bacterium]|nr:carboxypeptidase regulatory-like domain-containing protein [Cytophagales bacterium]MDW8384092.1 carboxypeptidase regulatory-like domain-containing protein [Flammeovirgaceae bacterium]